jgi:hypothetical protein
VRTGLRVLAIYRFDLVGVQVVRWDKGETEHIEDYNFSMEKNEHYQLGAE